MKCDGLKELTGKMVKEWYAWLRKTDDGCCSLWFGSTDKYRYCVCMGWHHCDDEPVVNEKGNQVYEGLVPKYKAIWKVAWKIGRQTHHNIMQCDLDVDFEMPYVTEEMAKAHPDLYRVGDVDYTLETVECARIASGPHRGQWGKPAGYLSWEALAAQMRKVARRVWKDWRKEGDNG